MISWYGTECFEKSVCFHMSRNRSDGGGPKSETAVGLAAGEGEVVGGRAVGVAVGAAVGSGGLVGVAVGTGVAVGSSVAVG